MIIDEISPYLGEAQLESICRLGLHEWQVLISLDNEVYRGTGGTIEQALCEACEGIHPVGTLFATAYVEGRHKPAKIDARAMLASLGMIKKTVVVRRF